MLDTMIYATAAALKHGVNGISDLGWQRLREQRETPPTAGNPLKPEKRVYLSSRLAR